MAEEMSTLMAKEMSTLMADDPTMPRPAGSVAAPTGDTERRRYSFQRSADVSGRSVGEILYLVALLVAGGADAAAFHQVVSLVMPREEDWLIALLVVGLTLVALLLAHFSGRLAREVVAGMGRATWRSVLWCAVPWLLLGLTAVVVRIVVAPGSHAAVDPNATSYSRGDGTAPIAAALFAMLYAGSGVIAAVAEFFSHNPLRSDYRRAHRNHRGAQRRLARSQPAYQRALHVRELHRAAHLQDEDNYRAAMKKQLAYAEELKRYAAVLIAIYLQDPSATDGMTQEDWRPMITTPVYPQTAGPNQTPPVTPIPPTTQAPATQDPTTTQAQTTGSGLPGVPIKPQQTDPNAHNHSRAA
jgi:hypothetical protein